MQGDTASELATYLHAVHALLARQEDLTRAMVRDTELYLGGGIGREQLAQAALFQIEAYVEIEADAAALPVPPRAQRAHALYLQAFAACGEAHQRLLRAIDLTGVPDLSGFTKPGMLLRAATHQAQIAADALSA